MDSLICGMAFLVQNVAGSICTKTNTE